MRPRAPLCDLYVLDENKQVVPASSYEQWIQAQAFAERTVHCNSLGNQRVVWTYFTGENKRHTDPPLTFETVVTGVEPPPPARCYATWAEAWHGHLQTVDLMGRILILVPWAQQPLVSALNGGKRWKRKPARASARRVPYLKQLRSNE